MAAGRRPSRPRRGCRARAARSEVSHVLRWRGSGGQRGGERVVAGGSREGVDGVGWSVGGDGVLVVTCGEVRSDAAARPRSQRGPMLGRCRGRGARCTAAQGGGERRRCGGGVSGGGAIRRSGIARSVLGGVHPSSVRDPARNVRGSSVVPVPGLKPVRICLCNWMTRAHTLKPVVKPDEFARLGHNPD